MYGPLFGFLLALVALYLGFLGRRDLVPYTAVHSLAELFGILVACSVFIVAWNFRRQLHNNYLLFMGVAYLFVGGLHVLHLLAFRGMDVFPTYGANLATQLWIASRYALSLAFLAAPLLLGRRLRSEVVFLAWTAAAGLVLVSIFHWGVFPTCYMDANEPNPLTLFKKISEVVIGLMFLAAIPMLHGRRQHFDAHSIRLIAGALIANAAAEIAFVFYRTADDPINLSGHLLLIVGAFLIFKALVQTNLHKMEQSPCRPSDLTEASASCEPPAFDLRVLLATGMLAQLCSVLVSGIGILVLAGWAFELQRLKDVLGSGVTMKPNAALCLTLAGLSLWLLQGTSAAWGRRAGMLLAMVVAVIGGLTLSEHVFGWDLGIDQALFREAPGALGTASPGRVGPPASMCFLLFGTALLLLDVRSRRWRAVGQGLTILGGMAAMLGLIGYLYDVPSLYAGPTYTGIAMHTAAALVVLCVGILFARPDQGLMAVVAADRAGGVMARRLLLASILVPIVLGWVRILGERQGHYESGFGVSVLVLSLVVIFSALIWRNAAMLNVLEEQRERARLERFRAELQLQEATQRLRSHVENSPLAVVEWDAQYRITRWTGAAEQCFGWSAAEVLGKSVDQIRWIHDDDAVAVNDLMRDMLQGRRPHTINMYRNYCKDGSVVHCEWYNSALMDGDGRMVSVLSLALDVTERREAQERIESLAEFPNENPSPVMRISRDGDLLYANKTSAPLLHDWGVMPGRKVPDAIGRMVLDCMDRGKVREVDLAYAGRVFAFVFTPLPQKDYVNVYARDVTARRRAEEGLRFSELRFRSTFNQAAVGMALVSPDGQWLMMNQRLCDILGFSEAELLTQTFQLTTHPEDLSAELEKFHDLMGGLISSYSIEKRVIRKDGQVAWVTAAKSMMRGPAGEMGDCIAIVGDITARRQAEEKVRLLTETLERRVVERTGQLEEANRELESFSYSVSHDLRAPLRHIDGFAQLLVRQAGENLDAQSLHYLKTITETVWHAGTLVDDLLAFSRMGRSEMRRSVVDVGLLVEEVRRGLEPEAAGRSIDWKVGSLPAVQADPAMLRIVLQNLLANAVKFTRRRPRACIEVGGREEAGEFVFFVRDNGVGFDGKYAEKLFGVFQRLHRPEEFEGTGIGLANVRRVIRRHGGRTWAEGEEGVGATFCFSLPKIVREIEG
jgi:PAS domain S-box-containing protein